MHEASTRSGRRVHKIGVTTLSAPSAAGASEAGVAPSRVGGALIRMRSPPPIDAQTNVSTNPALCAARAHAAVRSAAAAASRASQLFERGPEASGTKGIAQPHPTGEGLSIRGHLFLVSPSMGLHIKPNTVLTSLRVGDGGDGSALMPNWVVCQEGRLSIYSSDSCHSHLLEEAQFDRITLLFNFSSAAATATSITAGLAPSGFAAGPASVAGRVAAGGWRSTNDDVKTIRSVVSRGGRSRGGTSVAEYSRTQSSPAHLHTVEDSASQRSGAAADGLYHHHHGRQYFIGVDCIKQVQTTSPDGTSAVALQHKLMIFSTPVHADYMEWLGFIDALSAMGTIPGHRGLHRRSSSPQNPQRDASPESARQPESPERLPAVSVDVDDHGHPIGSRSYDPWGSKYVGPQENGLGGNFDLHATKKFVEELHEAPEPLPDQTELRLALDQAEHWRVSYEALLAGMLQSLEDHEANLRCILDETEDTSRSMLIATASVKEMDVALSTVSGAFRNLSYSRQHDTPQRPTAEPFRSSPSCSRLLLSPSLRHLDAPPKIDFSAEPDEVVPLELPLDLLREGLVQFAREHDAASAELRVSVMRQQDEMMHLHAANESLRQQLELLRRQVVGCVSQVSVTPAQTCTATATLAASLVSEVVAFVCTGVSAALQDDDMCVETAEGLRAFTDTLVSSVSTLESQNSSLNDEVQRLHHNITDYEEQLLLVRDELMLGYATAQESWRASTQQLKSERDGMQSERDSVRLQRDEARKAKELDFAVGLLLLEEFSTRAVIAEQEQQARTQYLEGSHSGLRRVIQAAHEERVERLCAAVRIHAERAAQQDSVIANLEAALHHIEEEAMMTSTLSSVAHMSSTGHFEAHATERSPTPAVGEEGVPPVEHNASMLGASASDFGLSHRDTKNVTPIRKDVVDVSITDLATFPSLRTSSPLPPLAPPRSERVGSDATERGGVLSVLDATHNEFRTSDFGAEVHSESSTPLPAAKADAPEASPAVQVRPPVATRPSASDFDRTPVQISPWGDGSPSPAGGSRRRQQSGKTANHRQHQPRGPRHVGLPSASPVNNTASPFRKHALKQSAVLSELARKKFLRALSAVTHNALRPAGSHASPTSLGDTPTSLGGTEEPCSVSKPSPPLVSAFAALPLQVAAADAAINAVSSSCTVATETTAAQSQSLAVPPQPADVVPDHYALLVTAAPEVALAPPLLKGSSEMESALNEMEESSKQQAERAQFRVRNMQESLRAERNGNAQMVRLLRALVDRLQQDELQLHQRVADLNGSLAASPLPGIEPADGPPHIAEEVVTPFVAENSGLKPAQTNVVRDLCFHISLLCEVNAALERTVNMAEREIDNHQVKRKRDLQEMKRAKEQVEAEMRKTLRSIEEEREQQKVALDDAAQQVRLKEIEAEQREAAAAERAKLEAMAHARELHEQEVARRERAQQDALEQQRQQLAHDRDAALLELEQFNQQKVAALSREKDEVALALEKERELALQRAADEAALKLASKDSELRNHVERLNKDLEVREAQYQAQLRAQELLTEEKERELAKSRDEHKQLAMTVDALHSDLHATQQQAQAAEAARLAALEEMHAKREALEASVRELEQRSSNDAQSLKTKIRSLKRERDAFEKEVLTLRQQLSELEEDLTSRAKKREDEFLELKMKREKQMFELQASLADMAQQRLLEAEAMAAKVQELEAAKREREGQAGNLERKVSQLQDLISERDSQMRGVDDELQGSVSESRSLKRAVSDLSIELDSIRKRNEEAEAQRQAELMQLQSKHKETVQQIERTWLEDEQRRAADVDGMRHKVRDLIADRNAKEKHIQVLQQELRDVESSKDALARQLEQLQIQLQRQLRFAEEDRSLSDQRSRLGGDEVEATRRRYTVAVVARDAAVLGCQHLAEHLHQLRFVADDITSNLAGSSLSVSTPGDSTESSDLFDASATPEVVESVLKAANVDFDKTLDWIRRSKGRATQDKKTVVRLQQEVSDLSRAKVELESQLQAAELAMDTLRLETSQQIMNNRQVITNHELKLSELHRNLEEAHISAARLTELLSQREKELDQMTRVSQNKLIEMHETSSHNMKALSDRWGALCVTELRSSEVRIRSEIDALEHTSFVVLEQEHRSVCINAEQTQWAATQLWGAECDQRSFLETHQACAFALMYSRFHMEWYCDTQLMFAVDTVWQDALGVLAGHFLQSTVDTQLHMFHSVSEALTLLGESVPDVLQEALLSSESTTSPLTSAAASPPQACLSESCTGVLIDRLLQECFRRRRTLHEISAMVTEDATPAATSSSLSTNTQLHTPRTDSVTDNSCVDGNATSAALDAAADSANQPPQPTPSRQRRMSLKQGSEWVRRRKQQQQASPPATHSLQDYHAFEGSMTTDDGLHNAFSAAASYDFDNNLEPSLAASCDMSPPTAVVEAQEGIVVIDVAPARRDDPEAAVEALRDKLRQLESLLEDQRSVERNLREALRIGSSAASPSAMVAGLALSFAEDVDRSSEATPAEGSLPSSTRKRSVGPKAKPNSVNVSGAPQSSSGVPLSRSSLGLPPVPAVPSTADDSRAASVVTPSSADPTAADATSITNASFGMSGAAPHGDTQPTRQRRISFIEGETVAAGTTVPSDSSLGELASPHAAEVRALVAADCDGVPSAPANVVASPSDVLGCLSLRSQDGGEIIDDVVDVVSRPRRRRSQTLPSEASGSARGKQGKVQCATDVDAVEVAPPKPASGVIDYSRLVLEAAQQREANLQEALDRLTASSSSLQQRDEQVRQLARYIKHALALLSVDSLDAMDRAARSFFDPTNPFTLQHDVLHSVAGDVITEVHEEVVTALNLQGPQLVEQCKHVAEVVADLRRVVDRDELHAASFQVMLGSNDVAADADDLLPDSAQPTTTLQDEASSNVLTNPSSHDGSQVGSVNVARADVAQQLMHPEGSVSGGAGVHPADEQAHSPEKLLANTLRRHQQRSASRSSTRRSVVRLFSKSFDDVFDSVEAKFDELQHLREDHGRLLEDLRHMIVDEHEPQVTGDGFHSGAPFQESRFVSLHRDTEGGEADLHQLSLEALETSDDPHKAKTVMLVPGVDSRSDNSQHSATVNLSSTSRRAGPKKKPGAAVASPQAESLALNKSSVLHCAPSLSLDGAAADGLRAKASVSPQGPRLSPSQQNLQKRVSPGGGATPPNRGTDLVSVVKRQLASKAGEVHQLRTAIRDGIEALGGDVPPEVPHNTSFTSAVGVDGLRHQLVTICKETSDSIQSVQEILDPTGATRDGETGSKVRLAELVSSIRSKVHELEEVKEHSKALAAEVRATMDDTLSSTNSSLTGSMSVTAKKMVSRKAKPRSVSLLGISSADEVIEPTASIKKTISGSLPGGHTLDALRPTALVGSTSAASHTGPPPLSLAINKNPSHVPEEAGKGVSSGTPVQSSPRPSNPMEELRGELKGRLQEVRELRQCLRSSLDVLLGALGIPSVATSKDHQHASVRGEHMYQAAVLASDQIIASRELLTQVSSLLPGGSGSPLNRSPTRGAPAVYYSSGQSGVVAHHHHTTSTDTASTGLDSSTGATWEHSDGISRVSSTLVPVHDMVSLLVTEFKRLRNECLSLQSDSANSQKQREFLMAQFDAEVSVLRAAEEASREEWAQQQSKLTTEISTLHDLVKTSDKWVSLLLDRRYGGSTAVGLSEAEQPQLASLDAERSTEASTADGTSSCISSISDFTATWTYENDGVADSSAEGVTLLLRKTHYIIDCVAAELHAAIADMQTMLAERDDAIAEMQTTLAERDDAIAEMQTTLAERDDAIAEMQTTLAERNGTIAGMQMILTERDGTIAGMQMILTERDGTIAEMRNDRITLENKILDVGERLATLGLDNAALQDAIDAKSRDLKSAASKASVLEVQLAYCTDDCKRLQSAIGQSAAAHQRLMAASDTLRQEQHERQCVETEWLQTLYGSVVAKAHASVLHMWQSRCDAAELAASRSVSLDAVDAMICAIDLKLRPSTADHSHSAVEDDASCLASLVSPRDAQLAPRVAHTLALCDTTVRALQDATGEVLDLTASLQKCTLLLNVTCSELGADAVSCCDTDLSHQLSLACERVVRLSLDLHAAASSAASDAAAAKEAAHDALRGVSNRELWWTVAKERFFEPLLLHWQSLHSSGVASAEVYQWLQSLHSASIMSVATHSISRIPESMHSTEGAYGAPPSVFDVVAGALREVLQRDRTRQHVDEELLRCRRVVEASLRRHRVHCHANDTSGDSDQLLVSELCGALASCLEGVVSQCRSLVADWQAALESQQATERRLQSLERSHREDIAAVALKVGELRQYVGEKRRADAVTEMHIHEVERSLQHHTEELHDLTKEKLLVSDRIQSIKQLLAQRRSWDDETNMLMHSLHQQQLAQQRR